MSLRMTFCSVLILGAIAVVAGCGGDTSNRRAISGTVSLDGQPLQQGSISLQPAEPGNPSSGAVISAGRYSIRREQGLPPGKYRVVINAIKPGTGGELPPGGLPGDEEGTRAEELIPAEWNVRSEHHIEITESGPADFTHAIVTQ